MDHIKLQKAFDGESEFVTVSEQPMPFILMTFLMGVTLASCFAVASKIIAFLGITFSGGAIGYAFTFLFTDCISELYGKKRANQVVFAGLFGSVLAMAIMVLAIKMPYASFWDNQEGFENTLGLSVRLTFATLVAYSASQFHDVWAFHMWRRRTRGRHLWLRNILSTAVSQAIDTALFVAVAFIGIFSIEEVSLVMFGQYVIKLGIAVLDTPLVYLVVGVVRGLPQQEDAEVR